MQTTVNLDFGVIVAALAPTLAIIVTSVLANRARERIATSAAKEVTKVHTLVNDQLTREKQSRLDVMKSQKVLMERLIGPTSSAAEKALIMDLGERIKELETEIARRDASAATVATST